MLAPTTGLRVGFLPPWSAVARLSDLKDNDQKAERAVVHALGPAVADRPEETSGAGAPEGSQIPDPRDQQAESSCSAFAGVNAG